MQKLVLAKKARTLIDFMTTYYSIYSVETKTTENTLVFYYFWKKSLEYTKKIELPTGRYFIVFRHHSNTIGRICCTCLWLSSWRVKVYANTHYTPHNKGIKACKEAFIKLEKQSLAEVLTDLLDIVLKNNIFECNGQCYKQLYGTTIELYTSMAFIWEAELRTF